MHNLKKQKDKIIKVTIKNIIVAFIYCFVFLLLIHIAFGNKISRVTNFLDLVTIKSSERVLKDINLDLTSHKLTSYPKYGERYATIKIDRINIELPVYFGDSYDILVYGIGHNSGSYFPGEGGSIIYLGHSNVGVFRNLPDVQIGDIIEVDTVYGQFNYKVYDAQIILETELNKMPIQHKEEILMIYTCYPTTALGHTEQRYVLYSKRVEE